MAYTGLGRICKQDLYLKPECILSEGKWLENREKEAHHVGRDRIYVQMFFRKWYR